MANTYKWVISGLHTRLNNEELGLEKVIESIHWRYQAEDAEGNIADVYRSVGLEAPDAESFVAHEDLTQADVEAWLESKLVVEQLQAGLDAKLEAMANPTHHTISLVAE